jgi:hypothetical protein
MLMCDNCGDGWHTFCLTSPLDQVPPGFWLCPACLAAGIEISTADEHIAPQRHQHLVLGFFLSVGIDTSTVEAHIAAQQRQLRSG